MTWRSKVALPASWDPVDVMGRVGREALEIPVLHNFRMISNNSDFSDAFFQMVGDTQRLYLQFYEAISLEHLVLMVTRCHGIAFWQAYGLGSKI